MEKIKLLSQDTIDKIAAGEVVERPSSVVKELVENAIDAKAKVITVETEGGGTKLIRVTDDGEGILKDEIRAAFLRHHTSKLRDAKDLLDIRSLGFRGEALSSIAAVSRTEVITKVKENELGARYVIEGGREELLEDIASRNGTTFYVRNLFYNTPARRKFLKSEITENSYIEELITRLSLSNPDISFTFIANKRERLRTIGNGNLKDTIYSLYGREIAESLIDFKYEGESFNINGVIGEPNLNRGNRNYESFFVQGRYIKSGLLERALEEGYQGYLMQHQYPFSCLNFYLLPGEVDVNVHPSKMEVRFHHEKDIYLALSDTVHDILLKREDIGDIKLSSPEEEDAVKKYDPSLSSDKDKDEAESLEDKEALRDRDALEAKEASEVIEASENIGASEVYEEKNSFISEDKDNNYQITLSEDPVFKEQENLYEFKYIGQVFKTYILIEYRDKMFLIDQHAAHEKVLYEETMENIKNNRVTSQGLITPIIVSVNKMEADFLFDNIDSFRAVGYDFELFGGKEIRISAVPANIFSIDVKRLFLDMLSLSSEIKGKNREDLIKERIASMSCKAAVKGNSYLSSSEVMELIRKLFTLENPYHCPHGRPTMISMSRYELDKKFKRIV